MCISPEGITVLSGKGVELFFITWLGFSNFIITGIMSMNSDRRDYDEAVLFDFGTLDNMDDWLLSMMG